MKHSIPIALVLFITSLPFFLPAQQQPIDTVQFEGAPIYAYEYVPSCWGSKKVDALVAKTKEKEERWYGRISVRDFARLDAMQHFVYAFKFPEEYRQSCTRFPRHDMTGNIPTHLPFRAEGFFISKRQRSALLGNRDSTVLLMSTCIENAGGLGVDTKEFIVNVGLWEMIPVLISTFEAQEEKDAQMLTIMTLMMRNAAFPPFLQSRFHMEMYGPMDEEYSFREDLKRSIPMNEESTTEIIKMARSFHQQQTAQDPTFVRISKGEYKIGQQGHSINPERNVELPAFEISRYEVTNAEFAAFISATGYVTDAEQGGNASVFTPGLNEFTWMTDSTAYWRFPNGVSRGGIEGKMDHPVTCISWYDAHAYCSWAGVKLPSIEQWEVAARSESRSTYFFGSEGGDIHLYANIWKGKNHFNASPNDDFQTTAPVGSFKASPNGLYDVYGNVFEFCENTPASFYKTENVAATRGGSWWCSVASCNFFNSTDIGRVNIHASFSNNGFRVVR